MLKRLGNPQNNFSSIHVAGTNGKGSLCANLSSLGSQNGLLVGFFSSPHLITVEERARIDGRPVISEIFDKHLISVHKASMMEPQIFPTYFETTFLVSMIIFAEAGIDIAVIETGLGGRLDATRLVNAKVCAITTISKDHSEILGESLTKIASEKIAIYRQNVPIFSLYQTNSEVRDIFESTAGEDLHWFKPTANLGWNISQEYAIVIANYLGWSTEEYEISWPGRSHDTIDWTPGINCIVSAAHNAESIENDLKSIQDEYIMVVGMTSKPDISEVLKSFTNSSGCLHTIVTEPSEGRKPPIPSYEMVTELEKYGFIEIEVIVDSVDAFQRAEAIARKSKSSILVIGSIYLVGELMSHVIKRDNLDLFDILTIHPSLKQTI
jgi:folylpolyglutamate synthase/dihydropteroate synthase